jgi:peroxiredoxin
MRIRLLPLALLALLLGGCAGPAAGGGTAEAPAAPATTAAAAAEATEATVREGPERLPPPGLLPVDRREPAPALRVTAFDGRTVTLDRLRGRPAVVSFFESWCGVCRVEQPDLTEVAGEYAGRAGFVGVSYRDTVAAGRDYQRRFRVPYPLANDPSGKTWARWEVPYQPVVVLLDRQGRIAERFDGGTTGGTIRAALDYLAGE